MRHQILAKEQMDDLIKELLEDHIKYLSKMAAFEGQKIRNIEDIQSRLSDTFPIPELKEVLNKISQNQEFQSQLYPILFNAYLSKKKMYPDGLFEEAVTRRVLLSTLDRHWMEHLHTMDLLREGIGLRAWGQKDPLLEYKKEAFYLFSELLYLISEEAFKYIFRAVITITQEVESKG